MIYRILLSIHVASGISARICRFLLLGAIFCSIHLEVGYTQKVMRPFHYQQEFRNPFSIYQNAPELDTNRIKWVNRISLGGYALSALYLGTVWYANEELSHFHFFDDSREWQQMDKVGHALGGYHASKWMISLYRWSGQDKKKALIQGGLYGFLAMSSIEAFDGFGEKWGASVYDIGANLVGSGLAVMNQHLWYENRIQLKVFYWPSEYTGKEEYEYLFGTHIAEWIVKDYNGQTLWMSVRVHSFLPEGRFKQIYPQWLNLAVGYGAEGMIGGYHEDPWDEIRKREYRQLYLSLDIDLSNIPTRSGFLNTLFNVASIIRIPLPAIQFDQRGVSLIPFQ